MSHTERTWGGVSDVTASDCESPASELPGKESTDGNFSLFVDCASASGSRIKGKSQQEPNSSVTLRSDADFDVMMLSDVVDPASSLRGRKANDAPIGGTHRDAEKAHDSASPRTASKQKAVTGPPATPTFRSKVPFFRNPEVLESTFIDRGVYAEDEARIKDSATSTTLMTRHGSATGRKSEIVAQINSQPLNWVRESRSNSSDHLLAMLCSAVVNELPCEALEEQEIEEAVCRNGYARRVPQGFMGPYSSLNALKALGMSSPASPATWGRAPVSESETSDEVPMNANAIILPLYPALASYEAQCDLELADRAPPKKCGELPLDGRLRSTSLFNPYCLHAIAIMVPAIFFVMMTAIVADGIIRAQISSAIAPLNVLLEGLTTALAAEQVAASTVSAIVMQRTVSGENAGTSFFLPFRSAVETYESRQKAVDEQIMQVTVFLIQNSAQVASLVGNVASIWSFVDMPLLEKTRINVVTGVPLVAVLGQYSSILFRMNLFKGLLLFADSAGTVDATVDSLRSLSSIEMACVSRISDLFLQYQFQDSVVSSSPTTGSSELLTYAPLSEVGIQLSMSLPGLFRSIEQFLRFAVDPIHEFVRGSGDHFTFAQSYVNTEGVFGELRPPPSFSSLCAGLLRISMVADPYPWDATQSLPVASEVGAIYALGDSSVESLNANISETNTSLVLVRLTCLFLLAIVAGLAIIGHVVSLIFFWSRKSEHQFFNRRSRAMRLALLRMHATVQRVVNLNVESLEQQLLNILRVTPKKCIPPEEAQLHEYLVASSKVCELLPDTVRWPPLGAPKEALANGHLFLCPALFARKNLVAIKVVYGIERSLDLGEDEVEQQSGRQWFMSERAGSKLHAGSQLLPPSGRPSIFSTRGATAGERRRGTAAARTSIALMKSGEVTSNIKMTEGIDQLVRSLRYEKASREYALRIMSLLEKLVNDHMPDSASGGVIDHFGTHAVAWVNLCDDVPFPNVVAIGVSVSLQEECARQGLRQPHIIISCGDAVVGNVSSRTSLFSGSGCGSTYPGSRTNGAREHRGAIAPLLRRTTRPPASGSHSGLQACDRPSLEEEFDLATYALMNDVADDGSQPISNRMDLNSIDHLQLDRRALGGLGYEEEERQKAAQEGFSASTSTATSPHRQGTGALQNASGKQQPNSRRGSDAWETEKDKHDGANSLAVARMSPGSAGAKRAASPHADNPLMVQHDGDAGEDDLSVGDRKWGGARAADAPHGQLDPTSLTTFVVMGDITEDLKLLEDMCYIQKVQLIISNEAVRSYTIEREAFDKCMEAELNQNAYSPVRHSFYGDPFHAETSPSMVEVRGNLQNPLLAPGSTSRAGLNPFERATVLRLPTEKGDWHFSGADNGGADGSNSPNGANFNAIAEDSTELSRHLGGHDEYYNGAVRPTCDWFLSSEGHNDLQGGVAMRRVVPVPQTAVPTLRKRLSVATFAGGTDRRGSVQFELSGGSPRAPADSRSTTIMPSSPRQESSKSHQGIADVHYYSNRVEDTSFGVKQRLYTLSVKFVPVDMVEVSRVPLPEEATPSPVRRSKKKKKNTKSRNTRKARRAGDRSDAEDYEPELGDGVGGEREGEVLRGGAKVARGPHQGEEHDHSIEGGDISADQGGANIKSTTARTQGVPVLRSSSSSSSSSYQLLSSDSDSEVGQRHPREFSGKVAKVARLTSAHGRPVESGSDGAVPEQDRSVPRLDALSTLMHPSPRSKAARKGADSNEAQESVEYSDFSITYTTTAADGGQFQSVAVPCYTFSWTCVASKPAEHREAPQRDTPSKVTRRRETESWRTFRRADNDTPSVREPRSDSDASPTGSERRLRSAARRNLFSGGVPDSGNTAGQAKISGGTPFTIPKASREQTLTQPSCTDQETFVAQGKVGDRTGGHLEDPSAFSSGDSSEGERVEGSTSGAHERVSSIQIHARAMRRECRIVKAWYTVFATYARALRAGASKEANAQDCITKAQKRIDEFCIRYEECTMTLCVVKRMRFVLNALSKAGEAPITPSALRVTRLHETLSF